MRKRTVVLDFGGVVADQYSEPAATQLAGILGVRKEELEGFISERTTYGRLFRLGKIGPERFWQMAAEAQQTRSAGFDWLEAQRLWAETYVPNAKTLELMLELQRDEVTNVVVFSNMDQVRCKHVEGLLNWRDYCERFICSWETGFMKPDLQAFRAVVDSFSEEMESSRVLFVDDRPEHVAAAERAGYEGVLFQSPASLRDFLEHW